MNWISHSILYRSIEIEFKFINLSPLRIGAGRGKTPTSPVDLQVLKISIGDIKDAPYIPGSSLKGVIRSACERLALSNDIEACGMGEGCKNENDEELKNMIKSRSSEEEIVEFLNENYCLICKLFGSGTYSSHIQFSDAYPREGKFSTGQKTGIAIERRSGSVKRGALYTVEFVNPNSEFYGSIVFNNVPNYGIGLVSYVIDQINEGIVRIGGFKTRGFGIVKMEPLSLKGYVLVNGKLQNISEIKELGALDEYDTTVNFEISKPSSLLDNCKKAWDNYVNKIKKQ